MPNNDKARQLLDVHLLLELANQKRRLDIHLKDKPSPLSHNSKQHLHRFHLRDWNKLLIVVYLGCFMYPLVNGDNPGLMPDDDNPDYLGMDSIFPFDAPRW